MNKKSPLLLGLVLVFLALAPLGADSVDWPQYRGPERDGAVDAGVFGDGAFGLEVAWKKPLGSGFSGIAIRGERLLTMFTAGDNDVLAAFDTSSGEELWRYSLGKKYPALGGSQEGPLSTPTIHDDGTVYALGPWGRLVAVSLDGGEEHWAVDLDEKTSKRPYFGFTTSPVVVGDALVVQTGGPAGSSITAFDRKSGERRWSVGDASVNYQSPIALEAGGRTMVLAVNDEHCLGLDPKTGEALFRVEHGLGDGHSLPLRIADGKMLLNGMDEMAVFQLTHGDDGFSVEEVWRSNALRRSFALPVLHEGHLYGFNGNFLTCVDAATGETVWKSRPPGGRGLILVDGHLATVGKDGDLVIAKALPAGYEEVARVAALTADSYTAPSFAGGRFYARDLEYLVAVGVTDAPANVATGPEFEGEFGAFVATLEGAEDKATKIDEYLAGKSLPLIEKGGLVQFVYRGAAKDVAVNALGLVAGEREVALHPVPGTDLFARSVRLPEDAYRLYQYNVDFGTMVADPRNEAQRQVGEDIHSVLRMPEFESPAHLAEPEGERGQIEKFTAGEREIQVYLPPSYAAGGESYPLLVVHLGDQALHNGHLDRALDNLIHAGRIAPVVAALVPRKDRGEFFSGDFDVYVEHLAGEILPELEKRYRLNGERAVTGTMDGAFISLYAAMKRPDVFPRVAVQSLAVGGEWRRRLVEEGLGEGVTPRVFVQWMEVDRREDSGEFHRQLVERLEADGVDVEHQEAPGVAAWHGWELHWDTVLGALLPAD